MSTEKKKNSYVMFKEKSMRVAFYCAHKFFFQATSFTTAKKKKRLPAKQRRRRRVLKSEERQVNKHPE